LFSLVASGALAQELNGLGVREVSRFASQPITPANVAVLIAVSLLLSLMDRAVVLVEHVIARPKMLLVTAVGLNAIDALMTWYSVRVGASMELNPLIRAAGLPAKVLGVTAICYLIYRYAPRALIWPILALGVVCTYHLTGLLINR